jgi:hypothetical protein
MELCRRRENLTPVQQGKSLDRSDRCAGKSYRLFYLQETSLKPSDLLMEDAGAF